MLIKLKDYSVSIGEICLMSAINNILNYYKVQYDESCMMGLCEGNLFYFGGLAVEANAIINTDVLKLIKMGGMKYDINQMLDVIGSYLGLIVNRFPAENEEEVKRIIKHYIDKGTPILALVMANYLEYSVTYKKDNLSHAITVIGYDYENYELEVSDTYVNTTPVTKYEGKFSWGNFYKSLNLKAATFEMKTKDRLFAIELGETKGFDEIPLNVFHNSLVSMAKNNLRTDDFLESGIYSGTEGMRRFLTEVKLWLDEFSEQQRNNIMKCIHNLITNFGGPYVINGMMGKYLQTIYEKTNKDIYSSLQADFEGLQHQWYVFANICYKTVLTGRMDKNVIASRLEHIIEGEEYLFQNIINKLR